MNVLRRGGAALLLVCSALGVALCLGALVGVWVVHQPVKETVGDTLDTLDSALALADQTVRQFGDRLAQLRATLDGARLQAIEVGDGDRGALAARVRVAVEEVRSTLTTLRNVVQALSNSAATVNRTLAHLARLPGVVPPTLPDDLPAIEGTLSAIISRVDTLEAAVSDVSLRLTSLADMLGAVSGDLQSLDDRLNQWTSRLAAARSAIGSAKAAASTAIDLASVGLSLLLVLFGAGQTSLGIQAWRWLRAPSVRESRAITGAPGSGR